MKKASRTKSARLAEKLLQIRLQLGLSQNEMLQRLGFEDVLFRSNVSQYERGLREPPMPVLLEYARAANLYVDALINDSVDLPERLPSSKKNDGLERAARSHRKR